jgi:hypothetical protein
MTTDRAGLALAAVIAFGLGLGCASQVPQVRFHNAAVVWQVEDQADVPDKPSERVYWNRAYRFDQLLVRPITDPMAVRGPSRAANLNALDEVPDSTWFTNRIGVREVSIAEIHRGPETSESPEAHKPWTVLSTKQGGASPGLLIRDARGERYILKFDQPGFPEMETAADVIVQRLFWAAGYHVPEDRIVTLSESDLQIAEDAKVEDPYGKDHPMTPEDLELVLERIERPDDGRIRGVVSKFLPGEPIGGYPERGGRRDDPNDRIPHENRRELRAQYLFFAWVAHTDVKENNWLDIWREHPSDPKVHYVEHYLVDFGKALGVMGATAPDPNDGFAYNYDPKFALLSLPTFGLWTRPWEKADGPGLQGVGRFEAEHFHPARFRVRNRFRAFDFLDEHDALWAARILMAFTPEHVRAAVEEGELSDPRATAYLVDTLIARQRALGQHFLSRVNPLTDVQIAEPEPGRLRVCADDLLIVHDFDTDPAGTRYEVAAFDEGGRRLGRPVVLHGRDDGRVCADDLPLARGGEGYTMVRIATRRARKRRHGKLKPVWVHVARGPNAAVRVIGIWRE